MRFMVMMLPGEQAEAGVMPDEKILVAMGKYNEELVKAGVLLAGEGLHPSSKGVRVSFEGGEARVSDGPFVEAREVIGGFWIFQVKSMEEAIEWVKRCPVVGSERIEIRKIYEADDFGPALTPELRDAEERLRAQVEAKK
jgi:hypothetical protein